MRNSGSARSNRSTLRRYSRLIQASGCVKTNFLEADFWPSASFLWQRSCRENVRDGPHCRRSLQLRSEGSSRNWHSSWSLGKLCDRRTKNRRAIKRRKRGDPSRLEAADTLVHNDGVSFSIPATSTTCQALRGQKSQRNGSRPGGTIMPTIFGFQQRTSDAVGSKGRPEPSNNPCW